MNTENKLRIETVCETIEQLIQDLSVKFKEHKISKTKRAKKECVMVHWETLKRKTYKNNWNFLIIEQFNLFFEDLSCAQDRSHYDHFVNPISFNDSYNEDNDEIHHSP